MMTLRCFHYSAARVRLSHFQCDLNRKYDLFFTFYFKSKITWNVILKTLPRFDFNESILEWRTRIHTAHVNKARALADF